MATNTDAPFVISRRDAKTIGQRWYFEKPCSNGHISKRSTARKTCWQCHRERRAQFRADHPDAVKQTKAASYLRNRDIVLAYVKAYQAKNATTIQKRQKAFRQTNKERIAKRQASWSKANRHLLRIHERRRRDRKRGATGSHTYADIQDIGRMQRWRCANPVCRVSVHSGYHIDHVVPIALGGTNDRRNIQLLCAGCNQSKHARSPLAWAQLQGLLL